jgi:hypothetical protein
MTPEQSLHLIDDLGDPSSKASNLGTALYFSNSELNSVQVL